MTERKERTPFTNNWDAIEQRLFTMQPVQGGFSPVKRGIVTAENGEPLFVKIGVDSNTKRWAEKEVRAYAILRQHNYLHSPALVAHNRDRTAFALNALTPENDWDWSNNWTEERLAVTLEAMDNLANLDLSQADKLNFTEKTLGPAHDGWTALAESDDLQQALIAKLQKANHTDIIELLDFDALREQNAQFVFGHDLVHNDVRADNCAWNPRLQKVQLVDWNWLQFGDRRIDINAMLTHVHGSGFDVTKSLAASRLHPEALIWMAGFWLKAAATPIWPGGPAHLRTSQMESAVTAINLAAKI